MAKCLRCGADASWIQGNVKVEPADDALAERLAEALASEERTQRLWDEAERRLAEAVAALRELVRLKDSKDSDHAAYIAQRPAAWAEARRIVGATDSASVVQYKPCGICTTQSWCETHGCQCYPTEAICCLDYPRCDCNSPPEPDNAPTLQPCGHPWKAQHDFKCILCSAPGTMP